MRLNAVGHAYKVPAIRRHMPDYQRSLRSAYKHNAVPNLTKTQKRTIAAFYREATTLVRFRCPMCGKLAPRGMRHVDHRIPFCRGGLHVPENLMILCDKCNLKKGKYRDDEIPHWYKCEECEPSSPEFKEAINDYYFHSEEGDTTDWETLKGMWGYPSVSIDMHLEMHSKALARMEERGITDTESYLLRLVCEDVGYQPRFD